jgi:hypothetical protein
MLKPCWREITLLQELYPNQERRETRARMNIEQLIKEFE